MTGRRYYLTTTRAWQRFAHRCTEAHFIAVGVPYGKRAGVAAESCNDATNSSVAAPALILALVTADEAAHIALETDTEFEALPHPLSRASISERVAAALAPFGVISGDDTFTVAEKVSRVNPLLRHRVF